MSRRYVAVSALAIAALGVPVLPAAQAAASRPSGVSQLAAYQRHGAVTVRWSNPSGIDRDVVRIVRGTRAPADPSSGRRIVPARPRTSSVGLNDLAQGKTFTVAVWAERDGTFSRRSATTFTTKSTAPMRLTGVVAGKVVDTADHPLAGVRVFAYDLATFARAPSTKTGADGTFRLAVAPGSLEVTAFGANATGGSSDATGYLWDWTFARVHAGATRSGLDFALPSAGAVHGVVTDGAGNPIAGVAVNEERAPQYLTPPTWNYFPGEADAIARTHPDGSYRVKGLAPGAEVPCFDTATAVGDAVAYPTRCATSSVAIVPGSVVDAPTMKLGAVKGPNLGSVVGTVTDAHGNPVAHTYVYTERKTGDGTDTRTDGSGRFRLNAVAAGQYKLCGEPVSWEQSEPGSFERCRRITVVARKVLHSSVRLGLGAAVSGVARGPSGMPLPGVSVDVEQVLPKNTYGYGYATTDAHGGWTVGGLAPGSYQVCWFTPGASSTADPTGARSTCARNSLQVRPGSDRIGADRTLGKAGGISGRLLDDAGQPVPGAGISLSQAHTRDGDMATAVTDADGNFRGVGLTPGSYRVCTDLEYTSGPTISRCLGQLVTVDAGHVTGGADLALLPEAPLSISVTDGSGHGLSGVDVGIFRECTTRDFSCWGQPVIDPLKPVVEVASDTTDETGNQTFHALKPGHYIACAFAYYAATPTGAPATGYADKCSGTSFDLNPTRGTTTAATIDLGVGGMLRGRVTDAAGNAVRGATAEVGGAAASDYSNGFTIGGPLIPSPGNDIVTNAQGRYVVRSIAPGNRKVCASPPDGALMRRGCLSARVGISAGTATSAPTVVLAAAAARAHAATHVMSPYAWADRPTRGLRRAALIESSGQPEFRLLPLH
ncbi:MAG TPA: carboxypeptidase regulatory-like domain-containing protein [Jatrophihabitans sp.]|jgi:protocatechuate 3,4-dioxygenase beta subunit